MARLSDGRRLLSDLAASPTALRGQGISVNLDGVARSAFDLLSQPGIDLDRLSALWPELKGLPADVAAQLEIEALYARYLERQDADIRAFRRDEALELDRDLDYAAIPGLSNEVRAKLAQTRPATLGQAARISGVTPAAVTLLLAHVRRREGRATA